MKYLYKYPQSAYPYNDLVATNRSRGKSEPEHELLDTGVFRENRYFDVFVEYAKAAPNDLLIRITVENRGPAAAPLHLLPTLWFRNTWSWREGAAKPALETSGTSGEIRARHLELGEYKLTCDGAPELLFTENETNQERVFNKSNPTPFVKDSFNDYLVHGCTRAVNPAQAGTKAAAHYQLSVPAGGTRVVRFRFRAAIEPTQPRPFGEDFDLTFATRIREADEFYEAITPKSISLDHRLVMRQALAGMLWTKQYYYFDLDVWLSEHGYDSSLPFRARGLRNTQWYHMVNDHVISMPDKWEYPWYAAWIWVSRLSPCRLWTPTSPSSSFL
jgi:hypothetical protein